MAKEKRKYSPPQLEQGRRVCVVEGDSRSVKSWVHMIAQESKVKVFCCHLGSKTYISYFGNEENRKKVLDAIIKFRDRLNGRIISRSGSYKTEIIPLSNRSRQRT